MQFSSLSPSRPLPTTLDTIKFICKDLWVALFDKQIDNLRTNHRGVYVLQDNAFRPITRISEKEASLRGIAVRKAKIVSLMPSKLTFPDMYSMFSTLHYLQA